MAAFRPFSGVTGSGTPQAPLSTRGSGSSGPNVGGFSKRPEEALKAIPLTAQEISHNRFLRLCTFLNWITFSAGES
jgi:hypothetical protein